VWFAGSTANLSPLLLHYDGRSWKTLPAPSAPNEIDLIYDLAALAPDDAWAVGLKSIRGVGDEGAFTWHRDGVRWTSVPPPPGFASLAGLAAVATDDIWGVASSQENEGGRVLLAHWDGTSWQSIDTGLRAIDLSQAVTVSSKEFWAVGSTSGTTGERGVIAHWNGHSLRRVFTERRSGSDVFFELLRVAMRSGRLATRRSSTGTAGAGDRAASRASASPMLGHSRRITFGRSAPQTGSDR
jgi:hypothetical protein